MIFRRALRFILAALFSLALAAAAVTTPTSQANAGAKAKIFGAGVALGSAYAATEISLVAAATYAAVQAANTPQYQSAIEDLSRLLNRHRWYIGPRGFETGAVDALAQNPASATAIGLVASDVRSEKVRIPEPVLPNRIGANESGTAPPDPGPDNECKGAIDPFQVAFTQDSISANFKDGRSVEQLIQDLRTGAVTASDVPPIRLAELNGKLYTLDNRRLYTFREARQQVRYRMATESEMRELQTKFSTNNDGQSVRVRGRNRC